MKPKPTRKGIFSLSHGRILYTLISSAQYILVVTVIRSRCRRQRHRLQSRGQVVVAVAVPEPAQLLPLARSPQLGQLGLHSATHWERLKAVNNLLHFSSHHVLFNATTSASPRTPLWSCRRWAGGARRRRSPGSGCRARTGRTRRLQEWRGTV